MWVLTCAFVNFDLYDETTMPVGLHNHRPILFKGLGSMISTLCMRALKFASCTYNQQNLFMIAWYTSYNKITIRR